MKMFIDLVVYIDHQDENDPDIWEKFEQLVHIPATVKQLSSSVMANYINAKIKIQGVYSISKVYSDYMHYATHVYDSNRGCKFPILSYSVYDNNILITCGGLQDVVN